MEVVGSRLLEHASSQSKLGTLTGPELPYLPSYLGRYLPT